MLDKVLFEGDALYQTVISNLKTDGKFVQQLLSLEEIQDDFEVEIGKFAIEKFEIKSGPLIDAQILACQHFMKSCSLLFCLYHLVY